MSKARWVVASEDFCGRSSASSASFCLLYSELREPYQWMVNVSMVLVTWGPSITQAQLLLGGQCGQQKAQGAACVCSSLLKEGTGTGASSSALPCLAAAEWREENRRWEWDLYWCIRCGWLAVAHSFSRVRSCCKLCFQVPRMCVRSNLLLGTFPKSNKVKLCSLWPWLSDR